MTASKYFVPAEQRSAIVSRACSVALWACVLTQKLALPGGVEFPLIIVWMLVAYLFSQGVVQVRPVRLLAFLAMIAAIVIVQVLSLRSFSIASLMLGAVLYAPFNVGSSVTWEAYVRFLRSFQTLALLIGICALAQWLCQFARLGMPGIEIFLPKQFLFDGYNYMQPLSWGSAYFKPNGLFMLEASHTSQLLGLGLVIECCLFKRIKYIALMLIAEVSALSGTGILLLLSAAPFIAYRTDKRLLRIAVPTLLVVFVIAGYAGVLDIFLKRTGEFGVRDSSGSARFIEPFRVVVDTYAHDGVGPLFGVGPGNWVTLTGFVQATVFNPITKLLLEYGLFLGLVWYLFITVVLFRSRSPIWIIVPIFVQYNFLNGSFLVPIEVAYYYLFAGLMILPNANRTSYAGRHYAGLELERDGEFQHRSVFSGLRRLGR